MKRDIPAQTHEESFEHFQRVVVSCQVVGMSDDFQTSKLNPWSTSPIPTRESALAASALDSTGDFKVLRRFELCNFPESLEKVPLGELSVLVVDVETTGLDIERDKVIELACRAVRATQDGEIVGLGAFEAWLEDPGEPLSQEINELTGLSDEVLAGKAFDEEAFFRPRIS